MDIADIKQKIYDRKQIPDILENLGCHSIVQRAGYWQAANPDGDNKTAITVYDNEYLTTVDYTRNISDKTADIFDLVKFFRDENFFQALKTVCDWCGIDYYADPNAELPESIRIIQALHEEIFSTDNQNEPVDNSPLAPISEKILTYYFPYVNDFFKDDNISYSTQREFEVGYDPSTNRITIPVRDELKTLVGIQGRLFQKKLSENDSKYLFIEPCNKSKILYGLYKTLPYIERKRKVFVVESAKGVMQLWDLGRQNSVATLGKNVSKVQADKISRLCADVCFLFDKDVSREKIEEIAQQFITGTRVFAVIDRNGILDEKESPTDNPEKFKRLLITSMERIM